MLRREPAITLFINDFDTTYARAAAMKNYNEGFHGVTKGVLYENPNYPSSRCATLEAARRCHEFRVKDIVDVDTGEVLFELEHELRGLKHSSFWGNVKLRTLVEDQWQQTKTRLQTETNQIWDIVLRANY